MLKNYLKVAWRNIIRNKVYSGINILGLAAGMAVALLIGLWVHHEYSFDKFLPGYQRLYQVKRNFNSNGDTLTFATTSLKLADALRNSVPEIEYVAESDWMGPHGLAVGDTKIYINGAQIGDRFLEMFQYPLLKGSAGSVMKDAYSIVLTESTAKALFGNADPLNKMVRFDNKHDLKVTGILKDIPATSTLQFQFVVPFSFLEQTTSYVREERAGSFSGNSYQIFVKIKEGADFGKVAAKIRNIQKSEATSENAMNSTVILQPLANWHLYGKYENGKEAGGFIDYIRMFSVIGVLVLLIACINFINLTTARSEKRAKEVGIRKAIGSERKNLIIQFLMESFLLTFIAFIFSVLLVELALPVFNLMTGKHVHIPYGNPVFWLLMIFTVLVTALLAGSRPAFYLSSFQPVKVLKGITAGGRHSAWSRKTLVVLQFSCSIALIISTVVIYRQIQHAKDRPAGFTVDRLMITNSNDDLQRNYDALKQELLQTGIAESVSRASSPATEIYWHTDVDNWPGKKPAETIEMGTIVIGEDYFKTMGIPMKEGRGFKTEYDSTSVIFNETAIKQMRIKDPVGQQIEFQGSRYTIAGVAKDALMISPFQPADPTMYFISPGINGNLLYRLSDRHSTADAISKLTGIFNKYSPAYTYSYQFADLAYAAKFNLEVLIGKLAAVFAGLAIIISCLGLFGLAAFVAEKRTKEIGIRKVLGASVAQVWAMLSKDFILLVIISAVIASPLAFYFLQNWLQKYPYRISIGAGVFILSAAIAVILTLLTISFQAIRAGMANPVKSLRSE